MRQQGAQHSAGPDRTGGGERQAKIQVKVDEDATGWDGLGRHMLGDAPPVRCEDNCMVKTLEAMSFPRKHFLR